MPCWVWSVQAAAGNSEGGSGRAAGTSAQGGQHSHDRRAGLLTPLGMVGVVRAQLKPHFTVVHVYTLRSIAGTPYVKLHLYAVRQCMLSLMQQTSGLCICRLYQPVLY